MTALQAAERPRAADERRVLHAHLRPATPDGAWALRWALEDALRCASFDDVGRLVLVRRLRVGALPPRCGSALLTAAIERAWREAARSAVPALAAGDPGGAREAVEAPAVWFVSPAAATLAALARVIDGAALSAWFWPRAVPLLVAPGGRQERIVALLDDVLAAAPAAAAQAFWHWPQARHDAVRDVLSSMPAPRHRETLRRWTAAVQTPGRAAVTAGPRHDAPRADASASDRRRDRAFDDRASLPTPASAATPTAVPRRGSEATAATARTQAAAPAPTLLAAPTIRVEGLLPNRPVTEAPMGAAGAAGVPGAPSAQAPGSFTEPPEWRDEPATPATDAGAVRPASPQAVATRAPSIPPHPRPAAPLRWPWLHDARATAHGGFLWLLNLLPMIGFGTGSPPALVRAVLTGLMDRAGLPADDPQRDVLPRLPDDPVLPAFDRDARRWQARARRTLRRQTGLSVAELACRPAWVTVTPTHADLILPLTTADLRVRRRGLDRDPGWVPWLGLIVSFHFVAREDWLEPEMPDG